MHGVVAAPCMLPTVVDVRVALSRWFFVELMKNLRFEAEIWAATGSFPSTEQFSVISAGTGSYGQPRAVTWTDEYPSRAAVVRCAELARAPQVVGFAMNGSAGSSIRRNYGRPEITNRPVRQACIDGSKPNPFR